MSPINGSLRAWQALLCVFVEFGAFLSMISGTHFKELFWADGGQIATRAKLPLAVSLVQA